MKSVRRNQPYLRLALVFTTVVVFQLVGAPARAEPAGLVRDDGMPITVTVSSPEPSTSPTPGGGGGRLPKTGLNIMLIAGVGGGLVTLGVAALVVARRRSVGTGSTTAAAQ